MTQSLACLVLADDLTGACDTGLEFVVRGRAARVLLAPEALQEGDAVPVAALDTETRNLGPQEARAVMRRFLQGAPASGAALWYKKTDSTLRGNIAVELEELRRHTGLPVVFAPAFPRMGRTARGGQLLVDGVPVHQTFMGRDPQAPVLSARLADATGGGRDVGREDLENAARLRAWLDRGECLCCDAASDDELRALVRACLRLRGPEGILWAGSAGLAGALMDVLFPGPGLTPPAETYGCAAAVPTAPLLLVVGSVNPANTAQMRLALQSGALDAVQLDTGALTHDAEAEARRCEEALCAIVGQGRHALLTSTDATGREAREGRTVVRPEQSQAIAEFCGRVTAAVLDAVPVGRLFATGGETAVQCLRALRCGSLDLTGAADAGIPCARLRDGAQAGLPLVLKAGGFGAPEFLRELVLGMR